VIRSPDVSNVSEPLNELVAQNDKGEREHLGFVAQKRVIDETTVYLTVTEPSDAPAMWWIVFHDLAGRLCKIGYALERREICWQTFFDMSEADLEPGVFVAP